MEAKKVYRALFMRNNGGESENQVNKVNKVVININLLLNYFSFLILYFFVYFDLIRFFCSLNW